MKAFIITTFIGCFGVDEKKNIISFKLFPKDPEKIAKKIREAETNVIDEEKEVIDELKRKGFKEFIFNFKKSNVRAEPSSDVEQFIKDNLRSLAIEYKFVKDQIEFNQLITNINIELTKERIKKVFQRDSLIIQANNAIEELDKSINIFIERLREWYCLHFPEMDRIVESHEKFAKLIEKFGSREKIDDPELKQFVEKSMGADFTEEDIKTIQLFSSKILELYKLREDISKYVEKLLKEVAPNFTELAGPMLAAKLISKAGGLEKLARMASSTIQLLGSERSLFRFLHGKGKSPRFGILAVHPFVQNAPEKYKGRVARTLAAKLSIAAKMDYYSKEYKAEQLKKDLTERVKEILKS